MALRTVGPAFVLALVAGVAPARADETPQLVNVELTADEPDTTFYFRSHVAEGKRFSQTYPAWAPQRTYQTYPEWPSQWGIPPVTPGLAQGPDPRKTVTDVQLFGYDAVCTAPCRAALPVGTLHIALAREGQEPVEDETEISITGPSEVHGTYSSRKGVRLAGWITLGATVTAGLAAIVWAWSDDNACAPDDADCHRRTRTVFLAGAGLASAGGAVGLVLAHVPDQVSVQVGAGSVGVVGRF